MAIDLTDIAAGTGGFVIHGQDAHDQSGRSAASAGDVNGDGFDDLIIGASGGDAASNGKAGAGDSYVVFGKAGGFGAAIDLTTIAAGTGGFVIHGQDLGDGSGGSVASAGDVNGDGFDDLIIGAPGGDAASDGKTGAGDSYVIFGKAGGFAAAIDLATIAAGAGGFVIHGQDSGDGSGRSVASAGDVNGDGFADLIIGADGGDAAGDGKTDAGDIYVVFGKAGGFGAAIDLTAIAAGTGGFVIHAQDDYDYAGRSVASAGDVNGDGFDDLIIGVENAAGAGNATPYVGESYVVFGKASGFSAAIDLAAVAAGTGGFVIYGQDGEDNAGYSVASAGDVNGDGFGDLIIGAPEAGAAGNAKGEAGESYVVFGKAGGFGPAINLATIAAGTGGFVIYGEDAGDLSGSSVASAGDVNGDGFDDLIIGAWGAYGADDANGYAGDSYVVFGKAGGFGASVDLGTIAAGTGGFVIHGEGEGDQSGQSVASAGDVDGDGFDDLIIGADRGAAAGNAKVFAGDTYVVFGRDFTASVTEAGTDAAETLTGTAGDDVIVAGQGDDTILGLGGVDALEGGAGNDRIAVSDFTFLRVDGGSGTDTLVLDGTGLTLDLALIADTRLQGIEAIELGANTLRLTALEVLNLSDSSNTLRVTGSAGFTVIRDDAGWTTGATTDGFTTFTNGQATLLVQNTAPGITSAATANFRENTGGVAYQALGRDPEGESPIWSLAGADAAAFGIDTSSGAVSFLASPDFETPTDANGDNTYNIEVVLGDGTQTTSKAVTITVRDEVEIALGDIAAGSGGFVIHGVDANDLSGFSVASAGDVNGDGFDDVIIGAFKSEAAGNATFYAGESYVVFGKSGGFGAAIDLADIANGLGGFVLYGEDSNERSGISVASAGDVNGDGFDDLVIGAHYGYAAGNAKSGAGDSYVVFGAAGIGTAPINLADIAAGTGGFVIHGQDVSDYSGGSVASAGDVNGDGFADLIIGARQGDAALDAKSNAGDSYVVFGAAGIGAAPIDLVDIAAGMGGFVIHGEDASDRSGFSVASAGDVDGDGFDDLIIGTYFSNGAGNAAINAGDSYVVFGKAGGFGAAIDLATISTGAGGFVIHGEDAGDFSGRSVASAGDVNGDGFADLIIGATSGDGAGNARPNAGAGYVVFGKSGGFGAAIDLADIAAGTGGFVIHGQDVNDKVGFSVASAGDVNGDGFDDVIIGSRTSYGAGNANPYGGASYVVFGRAGGFGAAIDLAEPGAGFVVYGQDQFDEAGFSVASAGDVDGDGFDDLIIGAPRGDAAANALNDAGDTYIIFGRDFTASVTEAGTAAAETLTGTAGADVILGGQGDDTIIGDGGADALSGGEGNDRIEVSDLTFLRVDGGSGTDTLVVGFKNLNLDLAAMPDTRLQGIEAIDLNGPGNALRVTALEVLNLSETSNTLRVTGLPGFSLSFDDAGWVQGATAGGFTTYTNGQAVVEVQGAPPEILSATIAGVNENASGAFYIATAFDLESLALSWSLSGTDAGLFSIDGSSGAVQFLAPADFEAPADTGADNSYDITIIASNGAHTASQAVTITVRDVTAGSFLTGLADTAFFGESAVSPSPSQFTGDVAFVAEGPLDGATLTVRGLLAEDRLSIFNTGTAAGTLDFDGTTVFFNSTAFGTVTGGVGTTLSVAFNANATAIAVEALIESLNYTNASDAPTGTRSLTIDIVDAEGGHLNAPAAAAFEPLRTYENPFVAIGFLGPTPLQVAAPAFIDLDGDTDLDLVVGEAFGTLRSFRNDSGSYVELSGTSNPFNGIDTGYIATPAFIDLDGDGDLDLALGSATGGVLAFENTGGAFVELSGTSNPFDGILAGGDAAPSFVDFDGDGDLDLALGAFDGTLRGFENAGGAYTELTGSANPFANVTVVNGLIAAFGDLNGDGLFDIVTGSASLELTTWINTGAGFVANTTAIDTDRNLGLPAFRTAPSLIDIDGDGRLDVVAGTGPGEILAWRNVTAFGTTITLIVTPEDDGPPSITSATTANFAENGFGTVYIATASDPDGPQDVTWSLSGDDVGLFSIDAATGVLRFHGTPDFDAPGDLDGNNVYDIIVTAADGLASVSQAVAITVTDAGGDSSLTNVEPSHIFAENAVNAAPVLLDSDVVFVPGTIIAGTVLSVTGLLAEDRISIQNQGAGAGQIGFDGSLVRFEGLAIGTAAGGGGANFFVTLNGDATAAAVEALVESLTYANISDTPTQLRTLAIDLLDADGGRLVRPSAQSFEYWTTDAPTNAFGNEGYAKPAFVDLDGDGDLDLVVGGYLGGLTTLRNDDGVFNELTGTANPFAAVNTWYFSAPAFTDLDGDGDLDLVLGEAYGRLQAWQNDAGAYTQLTGTANPFAGIDVGADCGCGAGYASTPAFVDFDGDGDFDLVAGNRYGDFHAWRNMGTGSAFVALIGSANPFDGLGVYGNSTPSFVDIDGDGRLDLVSGSDTGEIAVWRNTGTGFTELVGTENPFDGLSNDYRSAPAFADLDGDGDLDIVIGNEYGELVVLRNTSSVGVPVTIEVTAENDTPSGAVLLRHANGTLTTFNTLTDPEGVGVVDYVWQVFDRGDWQPIIGVSGDSFTPGPGGTGFLFRSVAVYLDDAGTLEAVASAMTAQLGDADAQALAGGTGAQLLAGLGGSDTLDGNGGDDILDGGAGNDLLRGGEGFDIVSYAGESLGVEVNFSRATQRVAGAGASGDTISGFEGAIGGSGADRLIGSSLANRLEGGAGQDTLSGGLGADTLIGGAGNDSLVGGGGADLLLGGDDRDVLSYTNAIASVLIDLGAQTVAGGDAEGDTISGFEIAYGGNGADTLLGSNDANGLSGQGGDDILRGEDGSDRLSGGSGSDTLFGGSGNDTLEGGIGADLLMGGNERDVLSYVGSISSVHVDLAAQTASGGDAEGDTISGFELIWGSELGDTLLGDGDANSLAGKGGNDVLGGDLGNDRLGGDAGADTLAGGAGNDTLVGGSGADVFRYGTGSEGRDLISDYVLAEDSIAVSASGFGGGLFIGIDLFATNRYIENLTGAATLSSGGGQFVFETDAQRLWWDADGAGGVASVVIATLVGVASLGASEINVIA